MKGMCLVLRLILGAELCFFEVESLGVFGGAMLRFIVGASEGKSLGKLLGWAIVEGALLG
jgi:hypothetical protein